LKGWFCNMLAILDITSLFHLTMTECQCLSS
jgi:hypothetical protein